MEFSFNFKYTVNGTLKQTDKPDNPDFKFTLKEENGIITAILEPKSSVSFHKLELVSQYDYDSADRLFANGYQSWTVSREYAPDDAMSEFKPRLLGIKKKSFNPLGIWGAGDLTFHDYPEQSGVFYGYSYAYIRRNERIRLFASLNERVGYTIITFNTKLNTISFEKELQGAEYSAPTELFSLAVIDGEYDEAFDRYFSLMEIPKPRMSRKCGYTTWYNYYTKVTEDIVKRDLEAISGVGAKIDIFQIDDGYERAVGDWLVPDAKKFPSGMRAVADSIHSRDMLAGLWLAPFAVVKSSYIYKQHKDWLVHDSNGRVHYASHNWGGFYALDIYNEEVREYLKKVFDTVLNEWGYDMVKLDFLYACSIISIHGKTRGEIMCDAVDFLRECCGDKIILGCGCPLAAAFGKVDFMRIGADVGLTWENKAYSREDVSTQYTLMNTLFRRHLDGRAWLNDPDVFLLRDNNIKLSLPQRELIAKINSLCGNLLFVSDDVSTYTEKQRQIFIDTITRQKAKIISVNLDKNDDITVDYELDGNAQSLRFNIKTGKG